MGFKRPKERLLFFMSLIYLFAFSSLYIQLPGLYSQNGILPVDKISVQRELILYSLISIKAVKNPEDVISSPNFLRIAHFLNLTSFDCLEVVTVIGVFLSFLAFFFESFRSMSIFTILWLCYYTCYSSGQDFIYFQWDILLLEAGFLAIILANADLLVFNIYRHVSSDRIVIFLFKWLLFRLMFASGVVKLTSNCPTWWSLQALNYHFETQCLPTPLALYAALLPEWFLKLGVVVTFYIEIIVPFMFFIPLKGLRIFSFYSQLVLQVAIILTGNYNFFNLLTIGLCYSLLDDSDFSIRKFNKQHNNVVLGIPAPLQVQEKGKKQKKQTAIATNVSSNCVYASIASHLISISVIIGSIVITAILFKLRVDRNVVVSEVGFSKEQFNWMLTKTVHFLIYFVLFCFVCVLYSALRSAVTTPGVVAKVYNFLGVIFVGFIATVIVFSSIHVFTLGVTPQVTKYHPSAFAHIHNQLGPYEITNSYGLFRRMTTKRNEVILEYSNTEKGPWKALEFSHKPGAASKMPTIVFPHQPRLDWQMWFAALSKVDDNPWFYSMVYGILDGKKEIYQLLDVDSEKIVKPKFIRAIIVEYKLNKNINTNRFSLPEKWWIISNKPMIYMPPMSLESEFLKAKLKTMRILETTKHSTASRESLFLHFLRIFRSYIGQPKNLMPLVIVIILILLTKLRSN